MSDLAPWRAVLGLALVALALVTVPAAAQEPADDLPAVVVTPVDADAPNGGLWFTLDGEPGARLAGEAELYNPAEVAQEVTLYLADLTIDDRGDAHVGDERRDVGAWGEFDQPHLSIAARDIVRVPFHLTIPADAEPGDHLGAVVAESAPPADTGIRVAKRLAKRLYVTVPGDAEAALVIESVTAHVAGGVLPRHADVEVVVRNTGNIRLETKVLVDGRRASGSALLMSQSTEVYRVRRSIPIWGGHPTFRAAVTTRTSSGLGPSDDGAVSAWVFPGWVVLAVFLLVLLVLTLRELKRRLG